MTVPATGAWKAFCGYGSATLLQGLVAFIAVPMMIRVLGAKDFALWAIFEPLIQLLAQFSLLGSSHAYIRLLASGKASSSAVYFSHFHFGVYRCAAICCIGALASVIAIGFGSGWLIVSLVAVLIFLEAAVLLSLSVDRGESNAFGYAQTIWIKFGLLGLGLALGSWAGARLTITEFVIAHVAIDALVLLFPYVKYRHQHAQAGATSSSLTRDEYRAAIRYGLPIVAAVALAVVAANADRYLVHAQMPSNELPGYMIMARLAGVMSFAAAPINLWWPAARFRHARDVDGGATFFASATTVLFWYYLAVAGTAWALAPHFVEFYGQGVSGYDPATMGLLLLAAVATGMITPINIGTLNEGKTHWIVGVVGTGAVVGVGLAALLVPRYGYFGAGIGSLAAQCAALMFAYWTSQRIQPVTIRFGKLVALGVCFGFAAVAIHRGSSLWFDLGAVLSFIVLGAAFCVADVRRVARS